MILGDAQAADWQVLDSQSIDGFKVGEIHHIEFWHVDQAMWLFVDDKLVCGGADNGAYELSPASRAVAATGMQWDEIQGMSAGNGVTTSKAYSRRQIYTASRGFVGSSRVVRSRCIMWRCNAISPIRSIDTIQRAVGIQTSIPRLPMKNISCAATTHRTPWTLDCGSRKRFNRWVKQEVNDRTLGVVHKDLVVGRAFMVYFPAPLDGGIPLKKGRKISPDVGRARWIW